MSIFIGIRYLIERKTFFPDTDLKKNGASKLETPEWKQLNSNFNSLNDKVCFQCLNVEGFEACTSLFKRFIQVLFTKVKT